ncbi:thiosulfate:glutathione sulfurtransferase [Oryzias melastigma]|uniref:Thiosulfate:glutathione sulfurtransferase-like n=1 Tax=Oryzias melastigma TaxID=30732 RepID=A0A3B3CL98_ORYME|nr:thiosulfate:glutathione sulfurtransferase [Oryzias melastigma]
MAGADFGKVSYEELKHLLANNPNLFLVDVRNQDEWDAGHIPRAIHIQLDTVEAAFTMNSEDFRARYGVDKPPLDSPNMVFYCRTGKRSAQGLCTVKRLGYVNVRNYPGSYTEWSAKEGRGSS